MIERRHEYREQAGEIDHRGIDLVRDPRLRAGSRPRRGCRKANGREHPEQDGQREKETPAFARIVDDHELQRDRYRKCQDHRRAASGPDETAQDREQDAGQKDENESFARMRAGEHRRPEQQDKARDIAEHGVDPGG